MNITKSLELSSSSIGKVNPGSGSADPGLIPVDPKADLQGNVTNIINGVIAILGFACVVVMIIGGVQYMTSAGDTQKVTKAKNTILYGLIGLVICVLAFAIVNFVITNIIAQQ